MIFQNQKQTHADNYVEKNPINLFKLSVLAQPVNKTVVSVAAGV